MSKHSKFAAARRQWEREYIASALQQHGGNISHTADDLGFERSALSRKLSDIGVRIIPERTGRVELTAA